MKENKKAASVRLYPSSKIAIISKFGSLQKFIDKMIDKEIGELKLVLNNPVLFDWNKVDKNIKVSKKKK